MQDEKEEETMKCENKYDQLELLELRKDPD